MLLLVLDYLSQSDAKDYFEKQIPADEQTLLKSNCDCFDFVFNLTGWQTIFIDQYVHNTIFFNTPHQVIPCHSCFHTTPSESSYYFVDSVPRKAEPETYSIFCISGQNFIPVQIFINYWNFLSSLILAGSGMYKCLGIAGPVGSATARDPVYCGFDPCLQHSQAVKLAICLGYVRNLAWQQFPRAYNIIAFENKIKTI
jgi:hypothetical protein